MWLFHFNYLKFLLFSCLINTRDYEKYVQYKFCREKYSRTNLILLNYTLLVKTTGSLFSVIHKLLLSCYFPFKIRSNIINAYTAIILSQVNWQMLYISRIKFLARWRFSFYNILMQLRYLASFFPLIAISSHSNFYETSQIIREVGVAFPSRKVRHKDHSLDWSSVSSALPLPLNCTPINPRLGQQQRKQTTKLQPNKSVRVFPSVYCLPAGISQC